MTDPGSNPKQALLSGVKSSLILDRIPLPVSPDRRPVGVVACHLNLEPDRRYLYIYTESWRRPEECFSEGPPCRSISRPIPHCTRSRHSGSEVRAVACTTSTRAAARRSRCATAIRRELPVPGDHRRAWGSVPLHGAGLSWLRAVGAFAGFGYTIEEHAQVVGELVDHLGLDGYLTMGKDWGGPISMAVDTATPTGRAVADHGHPRRAGARTRA